MSHDENEGGFVSHLAELRKRLIHSFIFLIIFFIGCYFFAEHLYGFLVEPYAQAVKDDGTDRRLIFTALQETFLTYLKVSFFTAFFVTCPFILMQIWKFIAPGLLEKEKAKSRGFILVSSLLFFLGVLFGYYIISPLSINFLGTYQVSSQVINEIDLGSFISLVRSSTLASGIIFELPIIIYFLTKAGIVTPESLVKYRKYALVLVLILAAIITPPDVASQIIVAIPIVVLYQVSIFISRIVIKNQAK